MNNEATLQRPFNCFEKCLLAHILARSREFFVSTAYSTEDTGDLWIDFKMNWSTFPIITNKSLFISFYWQKCINRKIRTWNVDDVYAIWINKSEKPISCHFFKNICRLQRNLETELSLLKVVSSVGLENLL